MYLLQRGAVLMETEPLYFYIKLSIENIYLPTEW